MALKFPEALLISLHKKAQKIEDRARNEKHEQREKQTYLVVPNSQQVDQIGKMFAPELKIVSASGKQIGQLLVRKKSKKADLDSVVYQIPCSGCDKAYYDETGRGLKKRIQEHKNDIRNHRTTKALVVHIDEEGHLPKWSDAHGPYIQA